MGRKVSEFRIEDADSRDVGKAFKITEMGAIPTEKWALRALLAAAKSGVDIPDDIKDAPTAAIAVMGINAFAKIDFFEAEPLLDEMMGSVLRVPAPDNAKKADISRPLIETDIEEVSTLLLIRAEWLKLHFDFSKAVALLKSGGQKAAAPNSSATPTSPKP